MSEQNKIFPIHFQQEDGSTITELCTKENTYIFTHEEQMSGDHTFIDKSKDGETPKGIMIWRREMVEVESAAKYEKIVRELSRIGCLEIRRDFMTEGDKRLYHQRFGEWPEGSEIIPALEPDEEAEEVELLPVPNEFITPRRERLITIARSMLDAEYVMAHDFENRIIG